MPDLSTATELSARLREFFPANEVKWKPQTKPNAQGKAMAIAFIDARLVAQRLDNVVGVLGWSDTYKQVTPAAYECSLTLHFAGGSVTKTDVGGTSDQPDPGDKVKAGYSDAFKRAAVKFGIGAYLYRLGGQWVECDDRGRLKQTPKLPAWALPSAKSVEKVASVPYPVTPGQIVSFIETSEKTFQANGRPVGAYTAWVQRQLVDAGYGTSEDDWDDAAGRLVYDKTTALLSKK